MIEQARVNEVKGGIAVLGCKSSGSCKSCGGALCSTSERVFEATNDCGLEIGPGDLVDVYLSPGKTIAAGFMVLIVPLLLFIAAFLVVDRLSPGASEGTKALYGLIGFGAGFTLSWLYSRTRRKNSLPKILRVSRASLPRNG